MSGVFTLLDQDEWKEIPDRHVSRSGNVYAGEEYKKDHEVKLFVKKIGKV
jgi:hypothetical protein